MKNFSIILLFLICVAECADNNQAQKTNEIPTGEPQIKRGKKSLKLQDEKLKKMINTLYEFNAYHDSENLRYDVPSKESDKMNSLRNHNVSDNQFSQTSLNNSKLEENSDLAHNLSEPLQKNSLI